MIVFISYSSKNRDLVVQLAALLTEMGYDVRYDQQIGTGDDWWRHILSDIRACNTFVYALSPEYLDSYPCELEYNYAVALNRPVLPVMITPVDFGQTPTYIAQSQGLNFTDLNNATSLARLGARFRQLEQQPIALPSPLPPEPPAPIAKLNTVIERVTNWETRLTLEAQTTLLNDIRPFLRKRETRANALYALRRFRQRSDVNGPRDLYTDISDEIDSVLETYAGNMTPSQPVPVAPVPDPTPPPDTRPRPGNRVPTALMIIIIILVVTGIGVGGWLVTRPTSIVAPTNIPTQAAQVSTPAITQISPTLIPTSAVSTDAPTGTPISPPNTVAVITFAALATETPYPSNVSVVTLAPFTTATLNASSVTVVTLVPPVTANNQWTPNVQPIGGVPMVLVPPGCFKIGSDSSDQSDEKNGNTVCMKQPFWIDQFPVWQAQFKQFNGKAATASNFTGDKRPVESITWFEARTYCEQQRGGRLPTEAEYEYAARGPDDLIYPWGNTFTDANVVYSSNSGNQTSDVGPGIRTAGASWVGAMDMVGNVWEWTYSIYKAYPYNATDGREDNSDTNSARIVRGGSWLTDESFVRAAFRGHDVPSFEGGHSDGFRCVRSN